MEVLESEIKGAAMSFGEPLGRYTSLHLGGPADVFIRPEEAGALASAIGVLSRHGLPTLPIGGGTNLVVKDGGIEGAVLSVAAMDGLCIRGEDGSSATLEAGAGLMLSKLVRFSCDVGLGGVEGLAGIPGLLGGAIAGNAGAFGYEIANALSRVELFDPSSGTLKSVARGDISFGYRRALLPEGCVVTGAEIRLEKQDPASVSARVRDFMARKKKTQPLGSRSAGCVFKNPEGGSAGRLIEEAGLKGMRVGDIEVSRLHANFFINLGKGTAGDFLRLMDIVFGAVRKSSGVELEPEVRVVGR